MLKSMTGFGRDQLEREDYSLKIELRAVNSRYLDLNFRMPKLFFAWEDAMRQQITQRVARGKLDIYVDFQMRPGAGVEISPNSSLAAKYVAAYQALAQANGLDDRIGLELLVRVPDILRVSETELDEDSLQADLKTLLDHCLEQLDAMRLTEGENLKQDLLYRAQQIEQAVAQIEAVHPEILMRYKDQMHKRLEELSLQPGVIDNERLEIELAIYAEKKDIQEELTRIHSHLGQFYEIIASGSEVGRTLDFLSQELNREINTIGSKSSGYEISREVIALKSQLDKIREQLLNVE